MNIVFLSYLNRSGSTYFVNLLSKASSICVCPEADVLYELLLVNPNRKLKKKDFIKWEVLFNNDHKFTNWNLKTISFLDDNLKGITSFDFFIHILIAFKNKYYPACTTIIFKQNKLYKIYPQQKTIKNCRYFWINLIRDPRAIYYSQKNTITPQTGKIMCSNPILLVNQWNEYLDLILNQKEDSTKTIIVRYEEFILDVENTLNRILKFIKTNEKYNHIIDNQTQYFKWLPESYKSIHPNITKSPITDNIYAWQKQLSPVESQIIEKQINISSYYKILKQKRNFRIIYFPVYLYYYFKMQITLLVSFTRKLTFKLRYL
jgi:hypothetical protein